MSCYRQQAQIGVAPAAVWDLVGNVDRHPEWWPRVIDVHCDGLEQGCSYRQVYKSPMGVVETDVSIERLEGCRELLLRCLDTGTYTPPSRTRGGKDVTTDAGVDVAVLREQIQKTYTDVSVQQEPEFIFPTGRAADRQYRIKENRWRTRS